MRSGIPTAAFIIVLVLIALMAIVAGPESAGSSDPSPSCSPSASPSPSPTATPEPPASAELIHWALSWRRIAYRARADAAWPRQCLGQRTQQIEKAPPRSQPKTVWLAAGRAWKHSLTHWQRLERRAVWRLSHPGGSGWERWRPLIRYYWPAPLVGTAVRVVRFESGGRARVLNGGYVLPGHGRGKHVHRAAGLFQLLPGPPGWADPAYNVWYAYHRKYVPAGGWGPWAGCAAFQ